MRWLIAALLLSPGAVLADTFVLVPGAWIGAWYWDPIVAGLQDAGHTAVAVELTGQGNRIAEGGPEISVNDHIADVVAAIIATGVDDVILVAYSYGGRPATGAWDQARDHIGKLVWVEAVALTTDNPTAIPADDQSLGFLVTMSPDLADSGMFPPPPTLREAQGKPLAPMSLRSLYGPVTVTAPLPAIPGTYIYAEESSLPVLRRYGEHLAAWRGWQVASVPGGHDVIRDAPDQLLAALLRVADQ